jgi:hypothetical protein
MDTVFSEKLWGQKVVNDAFAICDENTNRKNISGNGLN